MSDLVEQLRGERNIARIDLANMEMRLRHRDAEIAELRAELSRLAELAEMRRSIGDTPDSWAALVRDAAIGRWLLSQAEDYDGHACFPDVPYMCPDLRESVEEAMKEQQP